MKFGETISLIKAAAAQWSDDKAPRLGAALSFYTTFSIAPLVVISVALTGFIFGESASRGKIVGAIEGMVGRNAAQALQELIQNADQPSSGILATIVGVVTLMIGSSAVFGELQDSLNTIWGAQPKPGRPIWTILRQRFISFAMVLVISFLLLVSLVISAILAALGGFFERALPGGAAFWSVVNSVISFGVITLLFAMIYKILPDVKLKWSDVWTGSIVTAFLFVIGKYIIALYLGRSSFTSIYGAAGSLSIALLWFYYSSLIFIFGAEFTHVYANRFGSQFKPKKEAAPICKNSEPRHLKPVPRP